MIRRDFLGWAGASALKLGLGVGVLKTGFNFLLTSPPFEKTPKKGQSDLFFIERSLETLPPLLTGSGPYTFIGEVVTKHSIFYDEKYGILPKIYKHTMELGEEHPRVGQLFKKHLEFSEVALKEYGLKDPTRAQISHAAIYSFAAFYGPIFTKEDADRGFKDYHIWKPGNIDMDHPNPAPWHANMDDKLPTIYPMYITNLDQTHEEIVHMFVGTDRIAHLSSHLFFVHMVYEALQDEYANGMRMSRILELSLFFGNRKSHVGDLDESIGAGWELLETGFDWYKKLKAKADALIKENQQNVSVAEDRTTGRVAPDYEHDMAANREGRKIAFMLDSRTFTQDTFETVIDELNSSRLNRDKTLPGPTIADDTPSRGVITRGIGRFRRRFPLSQPIYEHYQAA